MCVEAVKKKQTSKEDFDLTDVCVCVHEESSVFQMLHFHISVCFLEISLLTCWLLTLCITEPDIDSSGFTVDLMRWKPKYSRLLRCPTGPDVSKQKDQPEFGPR